MTGGASMRFGDVCSWQLQQSLLPIIIVADIIIIDINIRIVVILIIVNTSSIYLDAVLLYLLLLSMLSP
jgi:hypothetical protein